MLGDRTYESLARKGETMTTTDMVTYAYDQIDQARPELNAVSIRTKRDTLDRGCDGAPRTVSAGEDAQAQLTEIHRKYTGWDVFVISRELSWE